MFRKSFAVLVAVVMVMATGLPAFAEDEEWDIAPQLIPPLDIPFSSYFESSDEQSLLAALIASEAMLGGVDISDLLTEGRAATKIYVAKSSFPLVALVLFGEESRMYGNDYYKSPENPSPDTLHVTKKENIGSLYSTLVMDKWKDEGLISQYYEVSITDFRDYLQFLYTVIMDVIQ